MALYAKKKMTNETLTVEEAAQLVNEPAFERLDASMISFCVTQIIRHLRLASLSKEHILQKLLAEPGLTKVYSLFNASRASDVRKLAGRLLSEALYKSPSNQDFFCDLFDLDCTYGRVTINQSLPVLIKQKLAEEPDFLFSLHSMQRIHDSEPSNAESKHYWSFPEFKEISTAVLSSKQYATGNAPPHTDKSLSPSRSRELRRSDENAMEFVNFPDPQLYLVGF